MIIEWLDDAIGIDRVMDEQILVRSVEWIKKSAEIYRDWIGPDGRDLVIQVFQKMVFDLEHEFMTKYGALPLGGYYLGSKASGH